MTGSYTEVQRRAANQIWGAAAHYDFEPMFLAIHSQENRPDFYMNLVIGLAYKYYGEKTLTELFMQWQGDSRQQMLDDLAWLYIEQMVYKLESPMRPALTGLRKDYAETFFAGEYKLSRQEWMSKNQLVYTLQSARWSRISGRKPPMMTPFEKKMFLALTPENKVPQKEIVERLLNIYKTFHLFDGKRHLRKPLRLHFTGAAARLLTRIMPAQLIKTDRVVVMRSSQADNGQTGIMQNKSSSHMILKKEETDHAYIENCFGRSLYSKQELARIENELCKGNHAGCHVWFTDGKYIPKEKISAENRYLRDQAQLQMERNRTYYYKNQKLHQSMITQLSSQIRNCMMVHQQPDILPGRSGRLDPARVWRTDYVMDDRVFHANYEEKKPLFTVDLLLDASASRLQYQEMIAAQGVILSESLQVCHIPVRVSEFCSVRGYTVLRILKVFEEKKSDDVFRYFATGWNRDGLVMREMNELLRSHSGPTDRHLLILLTDAEPNDSFRIQPSEQFLFGKDYGEEAAVNDTAAEVRILRRKGICVSAVIMGTEAAALKAERIYGKEYTRIQEIGQLARAAGLLIQKEIGKINS